ncbi:hypothetical protein HDV05_002645 [Chytridiales sp. JEL 0842]|nr:hypothetical protein HDV05_002645 [Chytridiales sp. JEL 0842]
MTLRFKTVELPNRQTGPGRERLGVVVKFREFKTRFLEVVGPNGKGGGEEVDFLVTFHSHKFDKVKVDLYEGAPGFLRRGLHLGRGKLAICTMEDWHGGAYRKIVELIDPRDSTLSKPIGTIEIYISFQPIALSTEDPNLLLPYLPQEDDLDDHTLPYNSNNDSTSQRVRSSKKTRATRSSSTDPPHPPTRGRQPHRQKIERRRSKSMSAAVEVYIHPGVIQGLAERVSTAAEMRRLPLVPTVTGLKRGEEGKGRVVSLRERGQERGRSRSVGREEREVKVEIFEEPMTKSKRSLAARLLGEEYIRSITELNSTAFAFAKHDLPLTPLQCASAIRFLYKFENGLPLPRTGNIMRDKQRLGLAKRCMDHACTSYGSLVLGFSVGTLSLTQTLRPNADEKSCTEFLGLDLKDVLYWDKTKRSIHKPRYYIAHDRVLDAVVVCVQGTITVTQSLTDLNGEYFPILGGAAHTSILRGARYIVEDHLKELVRWCKEKGVKRLYCVGHSLGAGISALLVILMQEHLEMFKRETGKMDFEIKGVNFACPGVATHGLADPFEDLIDSYVMENDIVPRASFGSATAFKEMMIEAHKCLTNHIPEHHAFELLQQKRIDLLKETRETRGIIPGRTYLMYKTVRRVPRRHHSRMNIQAPLLKQVYKTVDLPREEKPDVPHHVVEYAKPEFFAFLAPRRHIFVHHMPWTYQRCLAGAEEWVKQNGDGRGEGGKVEGVLGRLDDEEEDGFSFGRSVMSPDTMDDNNQQQQPPPSFRTEPDSLTPTPAYTSSTAPLPPTFESTSASQRSSPTPPPTSTSKNAKMYPIVQPPSTHVDLIPNKTYEDNEDEAGGASTSENEPLLEVVEGGTSEPPSYWEGSRIPMKDILYRTDLPPMPDSLAEFTKSKGTVKSHDPKLDKNPDELFKFFLTHVKEKPGLKVHIVGTHTENYTRVETYTNDRGQTKTKEIPESKTVTDFNFYFDLSSYVSESWSHLMAVPKGKATSDRGGVLGLNGRLDWKNGWIPERGDLVPEVRMEPQDTGTGQWRSVLEEYTATNNWFKEIHLSKVIPWDYDALIAAINRAIRWTGYTHNIDITFPKSSHKIAAYSSHPASKLAQNSCVQCLCCISCLCIIAAPIYYLCRKKITGRLECVYPTYWGGQEFYERNAAVMVKAVQDGVQGVTFLAM